MRPFLYFLYTLSPFFYINFAPRSQQYRHLKALWRCVVSMALIAGIVLVFLLLGYLVYALINAEAF